jgi:lipoic acid synthetase/lipoyl(octanoyl) transferase
VAVLEVDRGGDITYHGPGQLVGYPILDLTLHGRDLHHYVRQLEEVIIRTIAVYGIKGWREQGLTGVWTEKGKIAAIGVGVKGWVSMHGFALNVKTDMKYFGMINPCGIIDRPAASMTSFGVTSGVNDVEDVLMEKFADVFEIEIIPARSKQDAIITS